MLLLLVPVGIATVIGLVTLWPTSEPTPAEQAASACTWRGGTWPWVTPSFARQPRPTEDWEMQVRGLDDR